MPPWTGPKASAAADSGTLTLGAAFATATAHAEHRPTRPAVEPLTRTDPTLIGPFRLLGRLGGGSMGQVYLGVGRPGQPVAVKVVRPHLAEDPAFRRRFAAEVAAARHVQGPFTPSVVDADPEAERPWLATAFLPGPSLGEAVDVHGPLPPQAVRALAAGVAGALQAIHAAGVLHRDLKPANVLLDADGPKVIDFGVARWVDASQVTQTGAQVGTIPFMAPEQADGRPVTGAADVFALGSLLAYAATGITPFGNDSSGEVLYRIVHADPDPAALACHDEELRSLIRACLDKDPDRRPSPGQIVDACAGPHPGRSWLPAALASQAAARGGEVAALLARDAKRRIVIRMKLGALPVLLASAVVAATVMASPGHTAPRPVSSPSGTRAASAAPSRISTPAPGTTAAEPSASASVPSGKGGGAGASGSPKAKRTASTDAPRLLGAPDFDGYCRATGQGQVELTAQNAYGWHCSADSGKGDDVEAVCAWTFTVSPSQVTNRVSDFNTPDTWQCWRATRELGPLDFDAYCRATGHSGAFYIPGRSAYGWYCRGSSDGIDTQAACQTLYGSTPPISRFEDFYDQNSWQCWG
nr:serine/threonine-protein kinase [Peterkaempfera griseoplana]